MRTLIVCLALLACAEAPALAQPSTVLAPLPTPDLPNSDRPSDFLRAAEGALAAGRTGEAQQALEMAQTRMLDRSVPLGQTYKPSDNPVVARIGAALRALEAHDRAGAAEATQTALASATAQGF